MDLKTVLLVQVVTLVSWLPCTFSYCTWAGANPYWTGTPTVEQVSGQSHGAPHCQWSVSWVTSLSVVSLIRHLLAPIDPTRHCI